LTASAPVLLNLIWGKLFLPGDAYPMVVIMTFRHVLLV
jgi:hypothetical protein